MIRAALAALLRSGSTPAVNPEGNPGGGLVAPTGPGEVDSPGRPYEQGR